MDQTGVPELSKPRKTAAELMSELEKDPAFLRRSAERQHRLDERQLKVDVALSPLIRNLNENGFPGSTLNEVVERNAPLPVNAVELLLACLPQLHEERSLESIIRTLGAASVTFDGRPLIECFQRSSDESVRWAVVNTIALTHPHSIDEWLNEKLRHEYWGKTLRELGFQK